MFMDIGFVNQFNHIGLTELEYLITANEGMFAEQYVAQELLTIHQAYISPGLFYWSREEKKINADLLKLPFYYPYRF